MAVHTWMVLWVAAKQLPITIFEDVSESDKNVIYWACLLHDVRKLGMPVFEGKDHIHPFKSAASVLEVFC